jgi:hypothetical protein
MTQLRKTVLLMGGGGLAVVVLGLIAYFGVAQPQEREAERKEVEGKLFSAYRAGEKGADGGSLPDPVFTGLVIKAKGETTALEKKEGVWRITQPLEAPADGYTADQIARSLTSTKYKDLIEENPTDADLEKYGLKNPQFTVTAYSYVPDPDGKGADDSSRKREVTVYGGIENPFDGSIYVRREGDKAIHSVEGGARYALEKTTFELRNKEVLGLEEPKLKRIDVKTKSNRFVLERDAQKAWRLVEPHPEAADASAVTAMINALRNERAQAFPRADEQDAGWKAALEAAQLDATFTDDAGKATRVRIDKREVTLAAIERDGHVTLAEVPDGALNDLDKNPQDLRDKTVVTFDRDAAAKLVFSSGGTSIVAEKVVADGGPEEWKITAPEQGPAKRWRLSSLLWNLSSLKATALGEEKPKSWAKYGLDKPQRSASVLDKDGKVLAKVEIGKDVDGKANQLYVRGSRDQVLEVDSNRLNDLPTSADDVLDRPAPPVADGGSVSAKN